MSGFMDPSQWYSVGFSEPPTTATSDQTSEMLSQGNGSLSSCNEQRDGFVEIEPGVSDQPQYLPEQSLPQQNWNHMDPRQQFSTASQPVYHAAANSSFEQIQPAMYLQSMQANSLHGIHGQQHTQSLHHPASYGQQNTQTLYFPTSTMPPYQQHTYGKYASAHNNHMVAPQNPMVSFPALDGHSTAPHEETIFKSSHVQNAQGSTYTSYDPHGLLDQQIGHQHQHSQPFVPNSHELMNGKRRLEEFSEGDSETEDDLESQEGHDEYKRIKVDEPTVSELERVPVHHKNEGLQFVAPHQLSIANDEHFGHGAHAASSGFDVKMEPQGEPDQAECAQKPSPILITSSEDEPKITKVIAKVSKEESRVVCIGRLSPCFAMTFRVPNPGSRPTSLSHWPRIKVKIRDAQHDSRLFFILSDPTGADVAKLDPTSARVVRQAMDKAKSVFSLEKLEVFIKRRPMLPGEEAGDAYPAGVNCHHPLDIIFNVPQMIAKFTTDCVSRFGLQLTHNGLRNMSIEEDYEHDPEIEAWLPRAKDAAAVSGEDVVDRAAMDMINSYSTTGLGSVKQPDMIRAPLLSHQEEGLYFMVEREKNPFTTSVDDRFMIWAPESKDGKTLFYNKALNEHVASAPNPTLGGILADDMGLGKTLSAISLIAITMPQAEVFGQRKPTLTKSGQLRPHLKATLIVVPKTLIEANWQRQINEHVVEGSLKVVLFYGADRTRKLQSFEDADIVITTYGTLEADSRVPYNRGGPLLPRATWFRIMLDEAHYIRNPDTNRARSCRAIEANRRWAITGTPIQNHMMDLGSLCAFLRIQPFDTKARFQLYIEQPFRQHDPVVLSRLRVLVDTMTLRRTKENLDLPEKNDNVVTIEMSEKERQLYDVLSDNTYKQIKAMTHGRTKMAAGTMGHFLKKLGILRQFCAHKQDMLSVDNLKLLKGFTADSPIEIEDEEDFETQIQSTLDIFAMLRDCNQDSCEICRESIQFPVDAGAEEEADTPPPDEAVVFVNNCCHLICPKCLPKFMKEQEDNQCQYDEKSYVCKTCDQVVPLTLIQLGLRQVQEFFRRREELRAKPRLAKQLGTYTGPSSKVLYLLSNCANFKKWNAEHPKEPPMKAVVFTFWTTHLDLIEIALEDHHVKYTRLDGRMGSRQRLEAIEQFEKDNETIIFLVSIGAGGVGLNLTAANVVFIMEPQWNPQAEQQAVDRVHRIGQTRPVTVARLIAHDTIEEKIQEIGKRKLELARVTLTKKLGRKEEREQKMKELQSLFARRR